MKKDRGFSLIELIIAIAILIILTGLLAPQFMKYIEKSRKAACLNNIDVMIQEYQVAMIDNQDIKPEEVLEMMVKRGMKCPSKGEYSIKHLDEEHFLVNCSIHGDGEAESTDPNIVLAEGVYRDMIEFIEGVKGKTRKEIEDILTKAGIDKNPSNDNIRKYLLKEVYGGSWPAADKKVFNMIEENLYIQSYVNLKGKDAATAEKQDVVTYIGKSKNDGPEETSKWRAYYIYDYSEKRWYKAPSPKKAYGIENKSWPEIKQYMTDNAWQPME